MTIINSIISFVNSKRLSQIDHFKKNPCDIQIDVLKALIKKAKATEIGTKYDFGSINTIKDFQERVPIINYDDLQPYILRLRQGEQNLLWPGEIKWFAKSSGTTAAKSKFIPVSKEALEDCHFRGGKDVLALYNNNYPENEVFRGKSLTLGGSHQINNFSNESYYGDLSAILIENLPFWTHFIKTPNQTIALMDEWEAKIQKMTEVTINENVTSLAGVPSWFLVLINHILKSTGKNNLLDIWPNLELFIHGGINFTPYKEQYKKIIPSESMHYMETYNASEGFFAIQDDPTTSAMLLMLDYGIFYEFMPMDEYGKEHPKTLTLDEVELNTNYALIISTNGGLWRYIIGDTIQFKSKRPFRIVISGRTRHFINAFGEEVIIDNAEKALKSACSKTNTIVKEYTAAPLYMSTDTKGGHQWLIEFEKAPTHLNEFAYFLDEELKAVNSDYEAKRYKSMTLEMPQIVIAKPDLFFHWMKKRGKLGGQNKVPRLSNDRKYMDELIELNNTL